MKFCSILLLILCATLVNIIEGSLICKTLYTAFDSDGDGNIYHLDRQNVTCDLGYSISSFKLQRNSFLKAYRYAATCCPINKSFYSFVRKNPFSIVYNGQGIYLDRQVVSCDDNFISSFQLKRLYNDISYTYTCSNNMAAKICYDDSSYLIDIGDVRNLEKLLVACRSDYFLAKFQLVRNVYRPNLWSYLFRCCK